MYSSLCFFRLPSIAGEYVLNSGDTLDIQVLNKPELNTKQLVGPNGFISLPLAPNRVSVVGLTVNEAQRNIKMELGKYMKDPDVVVLLTPRTIHIVQHFLKTDTIVYKEATTIEEAQSYAGKGYKKEIHYGDTIYVDIGATPTWWDNNWVAVFAAVAVVVGIGVNLRQ
jgi:Polysaccharide biosynthesis/export protein